MTERPWCGMCGGSCFRMEEHFGEEFLKREGTCDNCGIDLFAHEGHQPSGTPSLFCTECWNERSDLIATDGAAPNQAKVRTP